jgi:hypothetical protein
MWLIVLLAVVGLGLWALQRFACNQSAGTLLPIACAPLPTTGYNLSGDKNSPYPA